VKLIPAELAYIRSKDLYITKKCDGCGKLLNQTVRWTIADKPQVYCSAECWHVALFEERREARTHSSPGKCGYCGASPRGKRRGAVYCEHVCQVRAHRKSSGATTGKTEITVTPSQQIQQLAGVKIGG
jgi:hypothetical protein